MNHHNISDLVSPPVHQYEPVGTLPMILTLIPLCTIIFCIIFGNILVIAAVFKTRALRASQNIYLVSLACVDLSVGIIILPLNIVNQVQRGWYLGKNLCKIYCFLDITLCTLSILHLCCIAWDRYKAISEGVQYIQRRTLRKVLVTIGAITVLSFWISSPPLLGWEKNWLEDIDKTKECRFLSTRGYIVYSTAGAFFFPLIMMASLYVLIYYGLRDRIRKRANLSMKKRDMIDPQRLRLSQLPPPMEDSQSGDEIDLEDSTTELSESKFKLKPESTQLQNFVEKKQKFYLRKERNAAQTLAIVMAAFVLCWLPFSVMQLLVPFCCANSPPPNEAFEVVTWLGYINSGLNPVIYPIFNPEFRKAFKSLLHLK